MPWQTGRSLPKQRLRLRAPRRAGLTVWGDGLPDDLTLLWMVRSWEDVSPDELAFFMPTLARADGSSAANAMRRALTARLWAASHRISRRTGFTVARCLSEPPLLPYAGHIPADETVMVGAGALRALGLSPCEAPRHDWADDIAALDVLAAGCRDAEKPLQARRATLGEAVRLSMQSGINAGYLYPDFDWAHELFLTAAWTGHVARARNAWLPRPVAECLLDVLHTPPTVRPNDTGKDGHDTHASIGLELRHHLNVPRLVRRCERIAAGSAPIIVKTGCWRLHSPASAARSQG
ncbi:MAG: hypothetical protein ACK5JT_07595 [Hyphomicrobiaceae bacterium]